MATEHERMYDTIGGPYILVEGERKSVIVIEFVYGKWIYLFNLFCCRVILIHTPIFSVFFTHENSSASARKRGELLGASSLLIATLM